VKKKSRLDMRRLSRVGVAAKAAKKKAMAELRDWPLTSPAGVRRPIASSDDAEAVASWAAEMVALGRLTATDAKTITVAVSAWVRAHAAGSLGSRMAELEQIVATIEQNGSVAQQVRIANLERQLAARIPQPTPAKEAAPATAPEAAAPTPVTPAGPLPPEELARVFAEAGLPTEDGPRRLGAPAEPDLATPATGGGDTGIIPGW
jgi:hypothetical protein